MKKTFTGFMILISFSLNARQNLVQQHNETGPIISITSGIVRVVTGGNVSQSKFKTRWKITSYGRDSWRCICFGSGAMRDFSGSSFIDSSNRYNF